jgi:putative lipase involved disintegration of autophagic bodies
MYTRLFLQLLIVNGTVWQRELNTKTLYRDFRFHTDFTVDFHSVRQLAYMAHEVYNAKSNTKWSGIGSNNINSSIPVFDDGKFVHAYLFSNVDKSMNVVAFKGTSILLGDSAYNDKYNDNLYYSCCFYKQSRIFNEDYKACDVDYSAKGLCNKNCYSEAFTDQRNYYLIAADIVKTVETLVDFANSTVVFTGHSLGGTIATMMGVKYNKSVVTFQSPGERHYFDISGLQYTDTDVNRNVYHFGHNADTIFTGKCQGPLSWCHTGGYVLNTKCHIGNVCEYDAKGLLNMRESILTHRIKYVIEHVIERWNGTLPECLASVACSDCDDWKYL